MTILNVSYRKVGGLRFVKVGRLCLSWSISATYKPMKGPFNVGNSLQDIRARRHPDHLDNRSSVDGTAVAAS